MELDNQQRRYGWLGGIIDGEGYIVLNSRQQTKRRERNLVPMFGIVNTDELLITTVESLLTELGVGYYRNDRAATSKWKKTMRIVVAGAKRCSKFLTAVQPYLISKKNHAELVLEFIESRLSKNRLLPYSERELEIYAALKRRTQRTSNPLNEHTLQPMLG